MISGGGSMYLPRAEAYGARKRKEGVYVNLSEHRGLFDTYTCDLKGVSHIHTGPESARTPIKKSHRLCQISMGMQDNLVSKTKGGFV